MKCPNPNLYCNAKVPFWLYKSVKIALLFFLIIFIWGIVELIVKKYKLNNYFMFLKKWPYWIKGGIILTLITYAILFIILRSIAVMFGKVTFLEIIILTFNPPKTAFLI